MTPAPISSGMPPSGRISTTVAGQASHAACLRRFGAVDWPASPVGRLSSEMTVDSTQLDDNPSKWQSVPRLSVMACMHDVNPTVHGGLYSRYLPVLKDAQDGGWFAADDSAQCMQSRPKVVRVGRGGWRMRAGDVASVDKSVRRVWLGILGVVPLVPLVPFVFDRTRVLLSSDDERVQIGG